MSNGLFRFVGGVAARVLPEKRLFLRSDIETRFVRLTPGVQLVALSTSALLVAWTIAATAVLLVDGIGSDHLDDHAQRERALYVERLNGLSAERDQALQEARAAHERFGAALAQVSDMQTQLLTSETKREELTRGLEATHDTLRGAITERDDATRQIETLAAELNGDGGTDIDIARIGDVETTVDVLADALSTTAGQRDAMADEAREAEDFAQEMILESKLAEDRNAKIFGQLEDALTISVEPLEKMFAAAGLSTDELLSEVRRGYSGQGGPLTPMSFSTKGAGPDGDSLRANSILEQLDRMNLYRIAAQKAPFSLPVHAAFRFTSGFGPRWGRMHEGTDLAAAHGTPIYATADGVVIHAGRMSGYGNLVKIQHEFGIETRYAHMSKVRVEVGQRVSRGDRIGDMGNTGRSTGTHLHYEIRVGGKPVNPMTYIKAAQDVF